MTKTVTPSTDLVPMTEEEIDFATLEDKHAECWLLAATGVRQLELAERYGVSRATIQNWLKKANLEYRTRAANVDEERERIAGTVEAVLADAYSAHRAALRSKGGAASLAGSNYLRLVLDAARDLAHIRGIEPSRAPDAGGKGVTEVVVRMGGTAGGGRTMPTLEVGVRQS